MESNYERKMKRQKKESDTLLYLSREAVLSHQGTWETTKAIYNHNSKKKSSLDALKSRWRFIDRDVARRTIKRAKWVRKKGEIEDLVLQMVFQVCRIHFERKPS
jgi:hypothetical protein